MNRVAILKCRLVENEHDTPKILDFKIYDSTNSAINKMEFILNNITRDPSKKVARINHNMGISLQLTENYYPRQEWVVYEEVVRSW